MKNLLNFKWLLLSIVLSIASINTAWADTWSFSSGETIYYDFTAVDLSAGTGVNFWNNGETVQNDLGYDANGAGTVIAYTFSTDITWASNWAIAKTQKNSWGSINAKARQEGQNMLKFNATGNDFEWTTARTFTSGETIYFRDASGALSGLSEGDKWKQDKYGSYDGNIYAYFIYRTDGGADAWSGSGALVEGSWNSFNAVYEFTVPHVSETSYTWRQVIITRGTGATFDNSNTKDQTRDLALEVGYNYFNICNSKATSNPNKFRCGVGKYGYPAALVGSFNNWHAYANKATSTRTKDAKTIAIIPYDFTAGDKMNFKILNGQDYYGLDNHEITSSVTDYWNLKKDEDNIAITADVTGTYYFHYNRDDNYLGVYYPKARLTPNQVYYFDASASSETHWNEAAFSADFYFRYYDTEGNVNSGQMCVAANAIGTFAGGDGPIYYSTAPDNTLIGSIVVDRYDADGEEKWTNSTEAANGHARTSSTQNCFYITEADKWNPAVGWKTYCPPTESESFTDDGTSKISWQEGSNDGSTSGKAILVKTGTTIKVTASANKKVADNDMTVKYDFNVNSGAVTANATGKYTTVASTNNTLYTMGMQAYTNYNLDDTQNSTKSSSRNLYYKALNTYSVGHSLTNIAWGSGRTGDDQAAYSLDYTATLNTVTGYNRPDDITVMAGSTNITANCTWNSSTGAITIPGAYITGNITISAAGVAKQCTVEFDKNDGDGGDDDVTATYASAMTTIAIPHKIGYAFTGYYDSEDKQYYDASGESANEWDKATEDPVTLYAHWTADNKTFKANAAPSAWETPGNWTGGAPSNDYSSVTINGDVVLSSSVHIGQMSFGDGGKLTISAGATLEVAGAITNSDESKILIESDKDGQGALILNNSSSAKATVKIYAKVASHASFQCVALPVTSASVSNSFSGSDVYTYVWHEGTGWERRGYYTDLSEFEGIALMQTGVHTYTVSGTLVSTSNITHTLNYSSGTYVGTNMFGNSWTAPIKIAAIEFADGAEQTVYICVNGSWKGYPKGSAGETVIPALQAYTVLATKSSSITIKYKETVRDAASHTAPLQAPKHNTTDEMSQIKLFVSDGERQTDLRLFENEQFTNAFDNGWEARYIEGDGLSGQLYAQTDDRMTVLASPDLEGTVVGFIPGESTNYTISFEGDGEGYYLNDVKKEESTLIAEGNTYEFSADEATNAARFVISKTPISKTPTSVDNLNDGVKARKQLIDGALYIIRDGRMYNAEGAIVK